MASRDLPRIGPYESPTYVAEGGMAEVYKARDPDVPFERWLAIKLLKVNAATEAQLREFRTEAMILSQIHHQNVVEIHRWGRDEGTDRYFFSMTFVNGGNLYERIQRAKRLSVDEAGRIFVGALQGLEQVHGHGVVHRDIKPGNILLQNGKVPILGDLGIARVLPDSPITHTTILVSKAGTQQYMPPEQFSGEETKATDVYAMGLSLFFALTGKPILPGESNVNGLLGKRLGAGKKVPFEFDFPRHVPKPLREVIVTACQLRAEDRYPDATAMREALEEALEEAGEPTWLWWVKRVGLPVAAALVVAAVVLYGWDQWWNPRKVRELQHEAGSLDAQASETLERARGLDPAPSGGLLERLDALLGDAREYRYNAELEINGESFRKAEPFLEHAIKRYARVCRDLGGELGPRADAALEALQARVTAFRDRGGDFVFESELADLDQRLAALAPPDPGPPAPEAAVACPQASAQVARVEGVAEAVLLLDRLEPALVPKGLALAQEWRTEALAARTRADQVAVEDSDYAAELGKGERALADAERQAAAGDFGLPRAAFERAAASFREAAAIAPAARRREEARGLLLAAQGDSEEWEQARARAESADALYAERRWDEALAAYTDLLLDLTKLRAQSAAASEALLAQQEAIQARENALSAGALASAAEPLAAADAARDAGAAALAASTFAEAKQAFEEARDGYRAAAEQAAAALAAAAEAEAEARGRRDALLAGRECGDLRSRPAGEDCTAALAELDAARELLAQLDAPGATAGFARALQALAGAIAAEAALPGPPVIEARQPAAERLEVARNEWLRLSVAARDPNPGTSLAYRWTFDGQALAGSRSSIDFRPSRPGRVEVTVGDGQLSARAAWDVTLRNGAPTLAVAPPDGTLDVKTGQRIGFRAVVSDPDGDQTSTEFRLDGKPVATGPTYDFASAEPGRHQLEVIAKDPAGARAIARRTIEVSVGGATAPRPEAATAPAPSVWRAALERYEEALENKDLAELGRIWDLPPNSLYRQRWESKFKRSDPLEITISIREVVNEAPTDVKVVFDQEESQGGRSRRYKYEARLLKRDDDWKIVDNQLVPN